MTRARTIWEEGTQPGRQVALFGVASTLTLVVANLLISREVTWLFDISFIVLCVVLALRVRPADFFTTAMLPAALMVGTFAVLAILVPSTIAHEGDGTVQAFVTGLARHPGALSGGFVAGGLCLLIRHRFLSRHPHRAPREDRQ